MVFTLFQEQAKKLPEEKREPQPIVAHSEPKLLDENNLQRSKLIDEEYALYLFYGSHKMVVFLKSSRHSVNHKQVQALR
jgi:hypothetical protein